MPNPSGLPAHRPPCKSQHQGNSAAMLGMVLLAGRSAFQMMGLLLAAWCQLQLLQPLATVAQGCVARTDLCIWMWSGATTECLPHHSLHPMFAQVSGRAQESVDQAKQSSQEAWDNTKAATQETADKVRWERGAGTQLGQSSVLLSCLLLRPR
jgi:hypothetical protein